MDQKVRRSTRYRYPAVTEVADLLALARPIFPWKREAPVRHAIRVLLILQGMPWPRADFIGHSLVARARIERSVGQPRGYDTDTELSYWIPTEECPICDRRFVRAFSDQAHCSTACAHAAARNEAWAAAQVGACEPPRCLWSFTLMEPDDPRALLQ
jgi:hypothetical protein